MILGKLLCLIVGHYPEIRIRVSKNGEITKYYACGRCDREVSRDTWMGKWGM